MRLNVFFFFVFLLFSLSSIIYADVIPSGECPDFVGTSGNQVIPIGGTGYHIESVVAMKDGYLKIYKSISFFANEKEIDFVDVQPGDNNWKARYAIQRYSPYLVSPDRTLELQVFIEGSWVGKKGESSRIFTVFFRPKKANPVVVTDIGFKQKNVWATSAAPLLAPSPNKIPTGKLLSTWGNIKKTMGR